MRSIIFNLGFVAALTSFTGTAKAEVLFTDSFDGSAVDSSKWEIILPPDYGSHVGAAVSQNNGALTLSNLGHAFAKTPSSFEYEINGTFKLSNNYDIFGITLRSNAVLSRWPSGDYGPADGILVLFWAESGEITVSNGNQSGGINYNIGISPNTDFKFRVYDSGAAVQTYINDALVASFNSSYSPGSKVGFFSREGGTVLPTQTASLLDVSIIPEPSALTLLAVGLGGLAMMRRRRS